MDSFSGVESVKQGMRIYYVKPLALAPQRTRYIEVSAQEIYRKL